VKNCVVWMKYDFMKQCRFDIGDAFVDCTVVDLLNHEEHLISEYMLNNEKPFILIGGSYT